MVFEALRENGWDGISIGDVWIAFEANQIHDSPETLRPGLAALTESHEVSEPEYYHGWEL
jgi:hypothetical protein